MQIILNLKDESVADFANCFGFDESVPVEDFITSKLLDYIANGVLENANRQAIASVTPVVDVTSDGSQVALKESIGNAMKAKLSQSGKIE